MTFPQPKIIGSGPPEDRAHLEGPETARPTRTKIRKLAVRRTLRLIALLIVLVIGLALSYSIPLSPPYPTIASISPIGPTSNQTIIISGNEFGNAASCDGDTRWLQIFNLTRNWSAGHFNQASGCHTHDSFGDQVTVNVTTWTPHRIVVSGINGRYGGNLVYQIGDRIDVKVWNPQTGQGPAVYRTWITNTSEPPVGFPKITSVTPITTTTSNQTITITGSGLGNMKPCSGDTPWLELHAENSYRAWNAGYNTSRTGCQSGSGGDLVTLNITSWTPDKIVISGIPGWGGNWSLAPGDGIRFSVWNPETGQGPAIIYTMIPQLPPPRKTLGEVVVTPVFEFGFLLLFIILLIFGYFSTPGSGGGGGGSGRNWDTSGGYDNRQQEAQDRAWREWNRLHGQQ